MFHDTGSIWDVERLIQGNCVPSRKLFLELLDNGSRAKARAMI